MQKAKKLNKLTLSKETLRNVIEGELKQVTGGIVETDTPSECFGCVAIA
jgi:hypothetical protein